MPTISAFGDEIADDLETQIAVLASEQIRFIEFRGAWGKNILDLDRSELARAGELLRASGFGLSAIASPIGKSSLDQPRSFEQQRLDRAAAACDALGTRLVRVFSFYYQPQSAEAARAEVLDRMGLLAARAAALGLTLVHENEKEIFGDTAERCADLLASVDSAALRMAFDPANFVQCGVRPMSTAWPLLCPYVTHVHIKDASMADGAVTVAGDGDGDLPALLAALHEQEYDGFLTLEPHLAVAGAFGGFSGEPEMRRAIAALRQLLTQL